MVARVLLSAASAAVFLSAASILPAHAATIRVPSQEPTIQQGIDAAAAGDTVLVAPGTYTGPGNRGLDFGGRDLVLRSEAGADATIIDCEGDDRGIHLHLGEGPAACIEGFTVTHGSTPFGNWPEAAGGAILCDGASPTIRACRLIHNSAERGGGLGLDVAGARIEDCLIASNTAGAYGGGIYGGGGLEMIRCEIAGNTCGGDYGNGGGISFGGGPLLMTDCVLHGNVADNYGDDQWTVTRGGGLEASGTIRLTRCEFQSNVAGATNDDSFNDAAGGGAYIYGQDAVFDACLFIGNTARSVSDPFMSMGGNTAYGGGVACSAAVFTGCVFQGNAAYSEGNPGGNFAGGGGLHGRTATLNYCQFVDNSTTADLLVEHRAEGGGAAVAAGSHFMRCTFSGNSATTAGAAIHARDAGSAMIDNTIVAFSLFSEAVSCAGGNTPLLTCCDVYGNAAGDWVGCIAGQAGANGNFSADPLFCRPAENDYTIHADSPCAPDNAPGQCGLVGALAVGCGVIGVAGDDAPAAGAYVRVFPNPLDGRGIVEWNDRGGSHRTVRLYDLAGRLVLSHELGAGAAAGRQQLAWSDLAAGTKLPAGVYFLKLDPLARGERPVRVVVTK